MKKAVFLCFFSLTYIAQVAAQNYSEDIAGIIYTHCSNCHRAGEIGPFPLTNFNEVKDRGQIIKFATSIKYMPPWKPDPSYKNYQHENYLTDAEISSIVLWVDNVMTK